MERAQEIQFGQLVIVLGFASASTVAECLNLQTAKKEQGEDRYLGDIMVERGVLSASQVRQILIRQGKTILLCRNCASRYSLTEPAAQENLFRCPACGSPVDTTTSEQKPAQPDKGTLDGQSIAGCRLDALLFEDSITYAYKGWQSSANRDVVVRILKEKPAKDKEFAKRFLSEAAVAAKLRHPGIASIYDVGKCEDVFYICYAYVEGTTLEKILAIDKRFPAREAVKVALSIARALAYAHEHDVIHRNLTPVNVLFTKQGQIVVGEIGISKRVVEAAEGTSALGVIVGSPEFMAPEQIEDYSVSDKRSDIFALGAILYKMLSGQNLFVAENPVEVLARNLEGRYRRLKEVAAEVPDELARVVEKMVSRSPGDRYQSMRDVISELEALDLGRTGRLKETSDVQAAAGGQEELKAHKEAEEAQEEEAVRKEKRLSKFTPFAGKEGVSEVQISPEEKEEIVKEALGESLPRIETPPAESVQALPVGKAPSSRRAIFFGAGVVAAAIIVIFFAVLFRPGSGKAQKDPAEVAFAGAREYARSNPQEYEEQLRRYQRVRQTYPGTKWAREAGTEIERIEGQMRTAAVEAAWRDALNFLKENPGQLDAALTRLQKFVESYHDSPYGKEAREKIVQIEAQKSRLRTEEVWRQTSSRVVNLRSQKKFSEAIELLEKNLPPELATSDYRQRISSLKEEIYLDANRAYLEIEQNAAKLTDEGEYEEAIKQFESVIANFGLPAYIEQARRKRAEIVNHQKEQAIYLRLEAISACEDSFLLCQKGNYSDAQSLLERTISRRAPSDGSKPYLAATLECLKAARDYYKRAIDRISSLVGKKVSFKSQAGIIHEGTLKKFESGQLHIGEMPPLSVESLPIEEIISLSDASPVADLKRQQLARASYLYFTGMIDEALEVLALSENDLPEAHALEDAIKNRLFSQSVERAIILFDGQNMDAWQIVKGDWKVEEGAIVAQKLGSLQLKSAPKGRILLKLRARFTKNSLVALQFSVYSMDFTLLLSAGKGEGISLEGAAQSASDAKKRVSLEEFEWYSLELRADKEEILLFLDDRVVLQTDTPTVEPSKKPAGIIFDLREGRVELKDITLITTKE